jgi:hypothetical protein
LIREGFLMRLVVALLAFLFLSVSASAHGLDSVAPPAMKAHAGHSVLHHPPAHGPADQHQDPSQSMHCSSSSVCSSPVSVGLCFAPHGCRTHSAWPIALENLLRAHIPDRDPPVPRA